jgi:hypothetical protein
MRRGILCTTFIILLGCSSAEQGTIPFSRSVTPDDAYTIIWHGVSKAYRYNDGKWLRDESYDYEFDVVQKRYTNKWKSIKSLHRLHPDYDGKAGDRNQTMYFEMVYNGLVDQKVSAAITSTLGNGTGTTDVEFRKSELIMYVPNASRFAPFNKFRIKQNYNYEEGVLTETVELVKEKDGMETPFMKNEETAFIFLKGELDNAPTIYTE